MPMEVLDMREIELGDENNKEKMMIAIRPWAFRFLHYLKEQGFETYVLTGKCVGKRFSSF